MITDLIAQGFLAGIGALMGLMPSVPAMSYGTTDQAIGYGHMLLEADKFAPVYSSAAVVAVLLLIRLGMGLWVLTVWVYHQFWGAS